MSRRGERQPQNENERYLAGLQAQVEAADKIAHERWTNQEADAGHKAIEAQARLARNEAQSALGRSALKDGGGAKEPEQPKIKSLWRSLRGN